MEDTRVGLQQEQLALTFHRCWSEELPTGPLEGSKIQYAPGLTPHFLFKHLSQAMLYSLGQSHRRHAYRGLETCWVFPVCI